LLQHFVRFKQNANITGAMRTAICIFLALITGFLGSVICAGQAPATPDPWTRAQLIEPIALNRLLSGPATARPLIFNIGIAETIKTAKNVGGAREKENLDRFRRELSGLPKTTTVVIYCGCCPFSRCPNIRPAFKLLRELNFTNAKLLNIPTSLRADWIQKGFPME
jgi:hypothetical protein